MLLVDTAGSRLNGLCAGSTSTPSLYYILSASYTYFKSPLEVLLANMTEIPYSRPATPHAQHQLGFIGLGNMGREMCKNLAKHMQTLNPPLPPLLIYNRTKSKATELEEELKGAVKIVQSAFEIGQSCDLIFTSLGNDSAAKEVFAELLKGEEKKNGADRASRSHIHHSTIFVDTSTLYPTTSGEIERTVSSLPRRQFISAPAFGPPPMAEAAQLVFVVAGAHNHKKFVSQFLVPAMGRRIMDFGSDVERAASFKLIGNGIILSTIEMISEAMTLADKTGVGAESVMEWIETFFPAPSAIGYAKKILNNKFDGVNGFTLEGGIKDASHIRRLGESVDCPLPIIDIAHQHLIAARANGGKDLDWSSLVAGQRLAAGLSPFEGKPEMLHKE